MPPVIFWMIVVIVGFLFIGWLADRMPTYHGNQEFYISDLDGKSSALYLRRERYVDYAGGFTVVEYKRVTCHPGTTYTRAESDWFQTTITKDRKPYDTFTKLPKALGHKIFAQHFIVKPVIV